MDELKRQHDEILSNKPESMSDEDFASYVEEHKEDCPFCNDKLIASDDPKEGGDMDKTFTQEELDAAVSAAVAPVQAELDSLKESAAKDEVDSRVAEVQAESDTKIADLQAQLDTSVLEATNAKQELADLVSYLEAEKESAELAELYEAIKAERSQLIKEVANFPEEYFNENIDLWCSKDEAEFASLVESWKLASVKAETDEEEEFSKNDVSQETAMNNTRKNDTAGSVVTTDLENLFGARRAGINIRNF